MTEPTYTDPTVADAQASTDYTTNAALIDEQAGLNAKTYAQTKQDTINSYQQALDSLNYGLQQAGVSARSQYAGRNLYNAGGDLSGTGQLEGTRLVQPSVNAITNLQVQHESNLNKLATAEQQGGLDIRAKKADLLNSVLTGLRNRAMTTYKDALQAKKDEEAQALERAKLPGGAIDTLKVTQEQQAKGRTKLYQKDLANAVKLYGNDAIIKIGDQKFLLSAQERTALAQAKKTLNKGTTTPVVSQQRSNAYDASGKLVGYALYNPKTGQTQYTNLSGNQSIDPSIVAGVGSSPKTTVDPAVRADLVGDIQGGATLDQLFNAYPEMSVSEITSIYNSL